MARRRPPRNILLLAAALGVIWLVVTAALFVRPRPGTDAPADAVVLFAGGRGERLDAALSLMDAGVAPTLVVSNGTAPGWAQANRVCAQPAAYEVLCPAPDPQTTVGEAVMTRSLAQERGWDRITLVTSSYHAQRAGLLLDRCVEAELTVVGAPPRQPWPRTWLIAAREQLGIAAAVVRPPSCG